MIRELLYRLISIEPRSAHPSAACLGGSSLRFMVTGKRAALH